MGSNNARDSGWLSRLVARPWFWVIAISVLFLQPLIRTLLRERPQFPPVGAQVSTPLASIELRRETGERFGPRDLGAKVWVASFISRSGGETATALARIQRRLKHMGDSYRLVSFIVDPPAGDPIAALAEEARTLHANPRAWCFVTGAPDQLSRAAALFGQVPQVQVQTSPLLTLVDQLGRSRGVYDPRDQKDEDALVATLGLLVNSY